MGQRMCRRKLERMSDKYGGDHSKQSNFLSIHMAQNTVNYSV